MKTTIGSFTVSTATTIGGIAETMVFADGDEVDVLRVPAVNAAKAHKHMCGLYKLGALASYYSGSVGESVARSILRGEGRTIRA